ncbi:MAG: transcriptional regulator [Caulobacteraceae bacterium]|nr:transcriptional regulator [Caulobacteraceae bacterium]
MKSRSKTFAVAALVSAAGVALSGCISMTPMADGRYAEPIGGAPVTANDTAYSAALVCLGNYAKRYNLRSPVIAVGRIGDNTGKVEADGTGRSVAQSASNMAMTAFAKAGAHQVNRYDTSVSEAELRLANAKLITDDPAAVPGQPNDYRKINSGQVTGSDFNLTGSISEYNANLRSGGADMSGGDRDVLGLKAGIHGRVMVTNIAVDLQLNNTISQDIVDNLSYQKQIFAREYSAGLFRILNNNTFDWAAGEGATEPRGLALRAVIERAVVEIMANMYGMPGPGACMASDPIGGGSSVLGMTGAFTPAYNNLDTNNAQTRADPYRWTSSVTPASGVALRGRY